MFMEKITFRVIVFANILKKYLASWQSNNLLDILSVFTYMPDRWNHDLILEEQPMKSWLETAVSDLRFIGVFVVFFRVWIHLSHYGNIFSDSASHEFQMFFCIFTVYSKLGAVIPLPCWFFFLHFITYFFPLKYQLEWMIEF